MRKYVIEVTKEGIKKIFTDGDKTYEEKWVRDSSGNRGTKESCITAQLDQFGNFKEDELLELIDNDDLNGLWDYFEEDSGEEDRGNLVKRIATCSKCKTDLLSKYEQGMWGFGKIFRNKNGEYYTECIICKDGNKYPINVKDIEEIVS